MILISMPAHRSTMKPAARGGWVETSFGLKFQVWNTEHDGGFEGLGYHSGVIFSHWLSELWCGLGRWKGLHCFASGGVSVKAERVLDTEVGYQRPCVLYSWSLIHSSVIWRRESQILGLEGLLPWLVPQRRCIHSWIWYIWDGTVWIHIWIQCNLPGKGGRSAHLW